MALTLNTFPILHFLGLPFFSLAFPLVLFSRCPLPTVSFWSCPFAYFLTIFNVTVAVPVKVINL